MIWLAAIAVVVGFVFLASISTYLSLEAHSPKTLADYFAGNRPDRLPPPPPTLFDHDAAERKLFLEVPSAWWLDPNRWGDNPGWRRKAAAHPYEPLPVVGAPGCIDCGRSHMQIATQYGDKVESWFCPSCGNKMTARGARRRAHQVDLSDLDSPRCFGSRPGAQDRAENDCDHCPFQTGCNEANLLPLPPRMP